MKRPEPAMGKPYGIFDKYADGFCTLPAGADGVTLIPLEWSSREAAEHWLLSCRMVWASGKVSMPEGAGAAPTTRLVRDGWGVKEYHYWM